MGFLRGEGIYGTIICLAMLMVVLCMGSENSSGLIIGVEVSSNNFLFFILITVVGLDTCFSYVSLIFIWKAQGVGFGVCLY
jgi:hypothetical protein